MPVSYTHLIDEAVEYMKAAAKKSYSKKGDAVAVSYTHLDVYKRQVQTRS